jgi:hypothetical protein
VDDAGWHPRACLHPDNLAGLEFIYYRDMTAWLDVALGGSGRRLQSGKQA